MWLLGIRFSRNRRIVISTSVTSAVDDPAGRGCSNAAADAQYDRIFGKFMPVSYCVICDALLLHYHVMAAVNFASVVNVDGRQLALCAFVKKTMVPVA